MHMRALRRLDALDQATRPEDLNIPGFDFHALKGFDPTRYTGPCERTLVHYLFVRARRRNRR
jgi:hypothetical protein